MIGKIVTVTVDRKIGTYHPKHNDIFYEVNYGFVKEIMAGDVECQDAYILGISEPVDEFTGKVIAIIHRKNDVEDKWIVAPNDAYFSKEEIWNIVKFQEQFFDSEIIM